MRITAIIGVVIPSALHAVLAAPLGNNSSGIPMPRGIKELESKYQHNIQTAVEQSATCTKEKLLVRRSW